MTLLGEHSRFISFCAVKGHWQGKPRIPILAWCSCSSVFYRQDKPWRTIFNRRQIWRDQISTKSSGTVWIAITFWWFADQCQYISLLLLGAERKIPIATKMFGVSIQIHRKFQRTKFVILLILSILVGNHLSKKSEGRKFSIKWSHWSMNRWFTRLL